MLNNGESQTKKTYHRVKVGGQDDSSLQENNETPV